MSKAQMVISILIPLAPNAGVVSTTTAVFLILLVMPSIVRRFPVHGLYYKS